MRFYFSKCVNKCFGILLILIFPFIGLAQDKIDLTSAIEIALKNNATLSLDNLKIQFAEKQKETYKNIPKTNVGTEIGQINTNLIDTKFGVSQNISLPIVYKKQKELLDVYYLLSQSEKEIKVFNIKKNIHLIFNNLEYLNAKNKLLNEIDSLYAAYELKANVRFNKGESNLLDKTLGEQQRQNVQTQQFNLTQEMTNDKFVLKLILNYNTNFEPLITSSFYIKNPNIEEALILNNPLVLNLKELEKLEKAKSALSFAHQKPELMFGLNNTSFSGPSANVVNKTYTNLNRFSAIQFGVSIPLNSSYYKKLNEANKISEKITEGNTEIQKQILINNFEKLKNQYIIKLKAKAYFDSVRLPNVSQIANLAEKQYASGQINFIDLTNYLSQVFTTKAEYLDLINSLNLIDIELRFLN